jgi:hypothetical protein
MVNVCPNCNGLRDQILEKRYFEWKWVDLRSNSRMLFLFRIGAFMFCSRLRNTALYFSGTSSAVMQAGIER